MISSGEIFNLVVIGIPEAAVLTALTVILLKKEIRISIILATGTVTALAVLVFRMLNTGIHPAVAMIIMALLVAYFYKIPKLSALVASVITFLVLNCFELAGFLLMKHLYGFDIMDIARNRLLWVSFAWAKITLLALTAALLTKTNWYKSNSGHPSGQTYTSKENEPFQYHP